MLLSCHTHSQQTLHEIASYLHLAPSSPPCNTFTRQLLLEILVSHHERRPSQLEAINALPLYPTEQILWDENIVPSEFYNGESKEERCVQTQHIISLTIVSPHLPISACLALPKLNLQFLTLHDYLLRNFELFRLESTCEPTPSPTPGTHATASHVFYPNWPFCSQMRFVKTLRTLSAG